MKRSACDHRYQTTRLAVSDPPKATSRACPCSLKLGATVPKCQVNSVHLTSVCANCPATSAQTPRPKSAPASVVAAVLT